MNKILLALQYCPYDEEQAWELAHTIAAIEDDVNIFADILLWRRFDCPTPTSDQLKPLQEKFEKVHVGSTHNKVTGWPAGCNCQWWELAGHVFRETTKDRYNYDGVLCFEADCIPLAKDWIGQIATEWHNNQPCAIMGDWHTPPRSHEHINGNLVFHPLLSEMFKRDMRLPVGVGGWDAILWKKFKPHAKPSRIIYSDYRRTGLTWEDMTQPRHTTESHPLHPETFKPVFLHGVKSREELRIAYDKIKGTKSVDTTPHTGQNLPETATYQPAPQGQTLQDANG